MRRIVIGLTGLVASSALAISAAAYEETAVTNGGSISGKVALGSSQPEAQSFTIAKDNAVCGSGTRTVEWVRASGDALLDAVVYLEEIDAGKPFPAEANELAIDQRECVGRRCMAEAT